MNLLQAEQVAKSYGDLLLFESLSLSIDEGQKVALIARNGAGKSTFLRILAGIESADSGEVNCKRDLKTAFLEQEPVLTNELQVIDQVLFANREVASAIRSYQEAIGRATGEGLDEAIGEMDRLGAWDYENQVKEVLSRLKISDYHQVVGDLSGGQRKRVALAEVLLLRPDLLILDEPTNHLDLDMIEWLEEYLSQSQISLLMVTHDRYFLDRICTDIVEMADQILYNYKGNYQIYLDKRQERLELEQKRVDKAQSLMKKELEWVNRMPKARGTKAKYRMESFAELKEAARADYQPEMEEIQIEALRLGKKVLEIDGLAKAYGELKLFSDFEYKFQRHERIGLVGPNGVGKSTFLSVITGQIPPDLGQAVPGTTVRFGFYEQKGIEFNPNEKVLDVIKNIAEVIFLGGGRQMTASQFLDYFLFPPDVQYNNVSKLSGGERRRLYLCSVLMQNPNFLILDEPTNDLDIMTLTVLEDYLMRFQGCVVIVSHDRYFTDKVVDHLFVFEGNGKIRDFPGNYSMYRAARELELENTTKKKGAKRKAERSTGIQTKTKLTYKEKLEFEQLEKEIPALEDEQNLLEKEISSGNCSAEELQKKSTRIGQIMDKLEEKELRWLELSEYL